MLRPTRRLILGGPVALAGLAATGRAAWAESPIELTWDDLIPGGSDPMARTLGDLGLNDWGQMLGMIEEPTPAAVTTAFDGKRIRMPGFIVPLAFEGTGTTEFLLVPYVGACIHVPPPPPNQIVFVATPDPYETEGYFEPVWVTGTMATAALSTELADVGYSVSADRVEPYEI